MSEKHIESRLVKGVEKLGGLAWKFVSPGTSGVPDRIILFPHGQIYFVELKDLGKKPERLQPKRHEQLQELGFIVVVLDSDADVDMFLEGVRDEIRTA